MLAFAGCVLDEPRRLLLRDGEPVHLEPQAFDVLVHLAQNPQRVVSREELLDTVWGDRFVSDSALGTRIKEIRRATGDDGDAQTVIRTVRGRGYQLVAPVTEVDDATGSGLVGRDRDLREVLARSRPGTLVTVVGPGGVGKSSLARACADAAVGEVVLVDLSVLDEAASLLAAIGAAARLSDDEDPVSLLRGRDVLLLLDDADDLVADVAGAASAMLRGGDARIRLIVTCRETLGVEGEQVWPLLPLGRDASRELLVRRARELAPHAGLDTLDADELDRLTAAVDRLPLALEMLASTAAAVGVESLGAVLELGDVGLSRRDAPERHRSLDRLVAGSLDRLDPRDLAALVRLSAFAGAFTGEDAVAVLGTDAVDRLRSLGERSLVAPVVVRGVTRRQLLRTVRDAVRRRSSATQLHEAAAAHATYVATLLADADRGLRGPGEAQAVPVFARMADEARAAHAWARAHDRALAVRLTRSLAQYGYTRMWAEPTDWARALATGGDEPDVVLVLATAAGTGSRLAEARRLALPLLDIAGRVRLEGLEILSDVAIYSAEFEDAASWSRLLVDEAVADELAHHRAIGVVNLVLSTAYAGDLAAAQAVLDSDLVRDEAALSLSDRGWLQYARGEVLQLGGRAEGLAHLDSAAGLAASVDNALLAGVARSTAGGVVARTDPAEAPPVFVDVIGEFLRRGNTAHLTTTLREVVTVLDQLDEEEAAVVVGSWLLGPASRPGHPDDVERVRVVVGGIRDRRGGEAVPWAARGAAGDASSAARVAAEALLRHC